MERRTILKLVAAGVMPGSTGLVQIACQPEGPGLEFLSAGQHALLDALTEIILPADDRSPGASAAGVARYIDIVAADGTQGERDRWLAGMAAVDAAARERFGSAFADCDAAQQDEIVSRMASNEDQPSSQLDQFFRLVKQTTINGYYTSKVGIEVEMGYQGNTALDEFPGCTHHAHGEPAASVDA